MGNDGTRYVATKDPKHMNAMEQLSKQAMQEANKASSQDERKKLSHQYLNEKSSRRLISIFLESVRNKTLHAHLMQRNIRASMTIA